MVIDEAAKALISYGALGIVALAAIAAAVYLYRDAKAERDRNREAESDLHKEHRAEIAVLVDRYVSKAESMNARYHELAESLNESIAAQRALMERILEARQLIQSPTPRGGG